MVQDTVFAPTRELPLGFVAYQQVLNEDLIDCIRDIVSLQATYGNHYTESCNFAILDKRQASIESRLVSLADESQEAGVIAECCRLAAYICCYSVYTDIWKSSLIPLKQAEKLIKHLDTSFSYPVWSGCRDMFLWLTLVCTAVVQNAECGSHSVKRQYEDFMRRIAGGVESWENQDQCLQYALERFIYVDNWVARRFSNSLWLLLEIALSGGITPRKLR